MGLPTMRQYDATPFQPTSDFEVYCFLKQALEPEYQVVATPSTAYYSEWLFHYDILREADVLASLVGDFRRIESGSLLAEAHALVARLKGATSC